MLEPHESKKTAGVSSYMQDEEINHFEGQKYVGCCYRYGKKAIWHYSAIFVLTNATSVVRWAMHLQAVCPEYKNLRGEKQKSEKQHGQRSSKFIQQLQTDEAVEENRVWVITGGNKEGYRVHFIN